MEALLAAVLFVCFAMSRLNVRPDLFREQGLITVYLLWAGKVVPNVKVGQNFSE